MKGRKKYPTKEDPSWDSGVSCDFTQEMIHIALEYGVMAVVLNYEELDVFRAEHHISQCKNCQIVLYGLDNKTKERGFTDSEELGHAFFISKLVRELQYPITTNQLVKLLLFF